MLKKYISLYMLALLSVYQAAICMNTSMSFRDKKKLAFLMGKHDRTGTNSPIHTLDKNIIMQILELIKTHQTIVVKSLSDVRLKARISDIKDFDTPASPNLFDKVFSNGWLSRNPSPSELQERSAYSVNLPITPLRISIYHFIQNDKIERLNTYYLTAQELENTACIKFSTRFETFTPCMIEHTNGTPDSSLIGFSYN